MTVQEKRAGRLRIVMFIIITALILISVKLYDTNKDRKLEKNENVIVQAQAVTEAPVATITPEVVSEPTPEPTPVVEVVETPQPVYAPVSEDEAKNFIYQHESSGRLDAMNSIGACGLGQSLPCSKLESVCPDWRTNYACQDAWFTNYMLARYGSWDNARAFWLQHNWW